MTLIPFAASNPTLSLTKPSLHLQIPRASLRNPTPKPILLPSLLSLAVSLTLSSPLPSRALPSLNSQPPLLSPTTPFSESKNLQTGLENGYAMNLGFLVSVWLYGYDCLMGFACNSFFLERANKIHFLFFIFVLASSRLSVLFFYLISEGKDRHWLLLFYPPLQWVCCQ